MHLNNSVDERLIRLNIMESTALAFFITECRGVKFYDLKHHHLELGTQLSFRRNPFHLKDSYCVEVLVDGERRRGQRRGYKLGHVQAEASEWLSTLPLTESRTLIRCDVFELMVSLLNLILECVPDTCNVCLVQVGDQ